MTATYEDRKVVEVVSTNVANGVTYLLNVLLELEVPIFAGAFDVFWRRGPGGNLVSHPLMRTKFGVWVPALRERPRIADRGEPAWEWTHEWPYPQDPARLRILVVRDPRDALYSYAQRFRSVVARPEDLLEAPLPPLATRILEKWALQSVLWKELSAEGRFLLLRFEDLKANPAASVSRVLDFAGIARPADAVERAIEVSRTDRVKKHHDAVVGGGVKVIRRGQPFEWKERPDRPDLALYRSGYVLRAMEAFGYETDPLDLHRDAETRLAGWLAESSPRVASRWARRIYGDAARAFGPAAEAILTREFTACARRSWHVPAVLCRHLAALPPAAADRAVLGAHLRSSGPAPAEAPLGVLLARRLRPHLSHPFWEVRASTLDLLRALDPPRAVWAEALRGGLREAAARWLPLAPFVMIAACAPQRRLFALRNRASLALIAALGPVRSFAERRLSPLARWIDRRVLAVQLGRTG